MAFLILVALCLAGLTGCTGAVVNTAQLYQPVTGVIQMDIKVPAGESVTKVRFLVDDTLVSEDEDGSDGYAAELDTTELEADSLVKITAIGVRASGALVTLRENFILIGKQATDEADAAVEPTPEASGPAKVN